MKNYKISFGLLGSLLMWSSNSQAVTIQEMFANFSTSAVSLMQVIWNISVVAGIFIGGLAALKFKELHEGKVKLHTPIMYLFLSGMMFAFPDFLGVITQTLTAQSSRLATSGLSMFGVPQVSGAPGVGEAIRGILLFIALVGHVAFIRGLFLLKAHAEGRDGTLPKAVTHIFGGSAAINAPAVAAMLATTLAPGQALNFIQMLGG